MTKTLGAAAVLVLLIVGWFWWTSASSPESSGATPAAAQVELGLCDHQPSPPPLPATLAHTSRDIGAIVSALDTALGEPHKTWLRCFTLDDELLTETQHGFARWLRTTLRLRDKDALAALGATSPDEASSLIVLVYAAHLRGQSMSTADAKARRTQALAAAGVTR